jgi:hypothetical protein
VLTRYRRYPEPKSLDPTGIACHGDSVGLLQRRPVHAAIPVYIGKESNNLDDRQAGLLHNLDDALATFSDARHDVWTNLALPVLHFPAVEIAARTGLHRRTVERQLSGKARPHPRNEALLVAAAAELARISLIALNEPAPRDPLACLTAYLEFRQSQCR